MPKPKLVLAGCLSSADGPWNISRGNEIGLRVLQLKRGERIRVEIVGRKSIFFNDPGSFPFDTLARSSHYRVCKEVDEGITPSPTTVEVILNV